jgi:cytoskeletal protein RodZ
MFQNHINDFQAPGVEGDFASTNPFSSILAGPGSLVAPAGGARVGSFLWVGPQGQVSQSFVAGYQIGFLGRNEQALITQFLGETTLIVPQGFPITLFNGGDFRARFPAGGTVGNTVYADPNDGTPLAGATAPTLGTATASAGFSGTGTVTNASDVLTINTLTHGTINPGDLVAGTDIPASTTIVNQLTGTPGGVGTYTMSAAATAGAGPEAVTTSSSVMLVTAVADGSLNPGDVFSGTDVAAGTQVGRQVTPFSGVASILTGALSTLVVTSVQPGTDLLRVGASVVMNGVTAGTTISAQVSGTPGGVGSYTLSAAGVVSAGVPVTTTDSFGGTGLYMISNGPQIFGAGSAAVTITVAGTAQATGFKLRGTYSPLANELGIISTL